ncbi:MAG: SGNH/GDSL hydrolase family protein [Clostridia bacterium]|nr:SGNH/GDSL hydrolase family protein [Clostridia bacterium]
MTKITCLGDSIRLQYTPIVRDLLGADFEVYAPSENCRFAKHTLRGLFDWEKDMRDSRIVHWNNGLWDMCDLFGDGLFTSEQEYADNILRIADLLLSRHDTVIFATTTPVSPLNVHNKNADIKRYNDMIVPLLRARGVIINDLYSLVAADLDRYICDDKIHLSQEGIEMCAKAVADSIRAAEQTLPTDSSEKITAPSISSDGAPVPFEDR